MPPTEPAGVSKRAFARAAGASESRIRQLVERGTLPVNEDGTIPVAAGSVAWEAHRKAAGGSSALRPALPPRPQVSDGSARPASAGGGGDGPPRAPAAEMTSMHEAELAKKLWDARMAELRYQERSGELVPRADVRQDAEQTYGAVRAALLSLGARVALDLEAICAAGGDTRSTALQAVVDREVNKILAELHGKRFGEDDAPQAVAR